MANLMRRGRGISLNDRRANADAATRWFKLGMQSVDDFDTSADESPAGPKRRSRPATSAIGFGGCAVPEDLAWVPRQRHQPGWPHLLHVS